MLRKRQPPYPVHPVNQTPVVGSVTFGPGTGKMTTPYRPPNFEWERERRELEVCIKRHVAAKEHAAGLLRKLADERQGEIVIRLREIAEGLMR